MKYQFLLIGLILGTASAQAADLNGRTMTCSVNLDKTFGGIQNTTYQFVKGVHGEDVALIFREGSMDNGVSNDFYVLSGSTLAITLDAGHIDRDTPVYDISNPSNIQRTFKNCVIPGQGGGDARATCAQVVEGCALK